jgi:hypothetical protein
LGTAIGVSKLKLGSGRVGIGDPSTGLGYSFCYEGLRKLMFANLRTSYRCKLTLPMIACAISETSIPFDPNQLRATLPQTTPPRPGRIGKSSE